MGRDVNAFRNAGVVGSGSDAVQIWRTLPDIKVAGRNTYSVQVGHKAIIVVDVEYK